MGTVTADAGAAAALVAGWLYWAAVRFAHPRRSPLGRMALYLEMPRAHLGAVPSPTSGPLAAREALRRVLGPVAGGAVSRLERMVRSANPESLQLSLRQAGAGMSPEAYRREHLKWLIGAPLLLGVAGALTGRTVYVVVFFVAGIFAGARRAPERLKAQVRRRNDRTRSDLPTVASVLALKIENNKSLLVALSDLVSEGSGPVIDDLARAVHLTNAGYGEAAAFELVAAEAAEPAAARLYRFLAAATAGGVDLARALLDQASELRLERREELERTAARRQMSLVLPNLVFMAPVLFAFLLAPLPQLLFGK